MLPEVGYVKGTSMAYDAQDIRSALSGFERQYGDGVMVESELSRYAETMSILPRAESEDSHLVDLGANAIWIPLYVRLLGYRRITLVHWIGEKYLSAFDFSDLEGIDIRAVSANLDRDAYDLPDASADLVVSFEVIEHLAGDPMHLLSEANRLLKPGGSLRLTTPNVLWRNNVVKFLFGGNPYSWSVYTCTYGDRHNREWTPFEMERAFEAAGFGDIDIRTVNYGGNRWALSLPKRVAAAAFILPAALSGRVPLAYRNQMLCAIGRKGGGVRDRYPGFLYEMYEQPRVEYPGAG